MKNTGIGRQNSHDYILTQQTAEGRPQLNAATFTQTHADALVQQTMEVLVNKNAVNKSDYPQVAAMETSCLQQLANLYHLEEGSEVIGTSTIGSSEACYTAGLAMLFRWKEHQKASAAWRTPNLIISSAHHVCWKKFAVYHGVQLREIPLTLDNPQLNPQRAVELIDKDTIGIVATLGGTHLGLYDDIKSLNELLTEFNERSFYPVFIHVDAASGGLYAPFTSPQYEWDFTLKYVASINVSGHKYGLVPASVGWLIWRGKEFLPAELRDFAVPYLGGKITTFGINFSKPSAHIGVQYMEFLGRGRDGYAEIHNRTKDLSFRLYDALSVVPELQLLNPPNHLPVVCWRSAVAGNVNLYNLADALKDTGGWHVPTYNLPRNLEHITIQRFVCRADLTDNLVDKFVSDLAQAVDTLPITRSVG